MRTALTRRAVPWMSAAAFALAAVVVQVVGMEAEQGSWWELTRRVATIIASGGATVMVAVALHHRQRRRDWAAYVAQLRAAANTRPPRPHLRLVTSDGGASLDRSAPAGPPKAAPLAGRRVTSISPDRRQLMS